MIRKFSDQEGRYIIKDMKIDNKILTLVNIYSQVAKGSDLYRADKSTKLCMVVA